MARRPLPVAIVALAVLLALAAPALHMRLATSDASTYKKDDTARVAYDLLKEGFGAGFNGPLLLAVELPEAGDTAALTQISEALSAQDGIAAVLPPQLNEAGDTATMIAYPTTTPQDERTDQTVRDARSTTLPPVADATGARISIGGTTASNLDFSQTIRDKLPLFIGVVVGLSLLLLAIVFRSLLIPVKAGIFNLLSIAGAFGVVTLIFQDGNFASLFGDATGPIESFLPIMVFAVVFGLSMDYEVFLVSRMHEEWTHTKDAKYAVQHGLAMTGRVVTAAAIIMIAVFGAFAIGNERALAMMGVGFASAIFIDAFIIRLLAVAGRDAPRRSGDVVDAGVAGQATAAPEHRAARGARGCRRARARGRVPLSAGPTHGTSGRDRQRARWCNPPAREFVPVSPYRNCAASRPSAPALREPGRTRIQPPHRAGVATPTEILPRRS